MPKEVKMGSSLEEKTLENLVDLQNAYINLAEKFDKLSHQINSLLGLFETAAKSFAEKSPAAEKDRAFGERIDALFEQNKLIAKGITLIEEKMAIAPEKKPQQEKPEYTQSTSATESPAPAIAFSNRPLPKF